jgi:hypothetical protein
LIQVKATWPSSDDDRRNGAKEELMPATNVLFLTGIIAAFAVFALVLAWGEYQTRHLDCRAQRQKPTPGASRLPDSIVRSLGDQASTVPRGSGASHKVTS